ncbi:hypothetical protein C6P45_004562 [Maudiozyma exigua]|uniref:Dilute domain-containing protein n=1 Tax=Maudiozyma exigua TaxID=34358 RepID=A0A9P6WA79_MAUEX|nr:hypothetical protein C6P45_004562 [Kazachstania exigua]
MEENVWGDPPISNQTAGTGASTFVFGEKSESPVIGDIVDNEKLSLLQKSLDKCPSLDDSSVNEIQVPWIELVQLITDTARDEEFRTFGQILQNVKNVNDKSLTGVALIHYIIAYDRPNYIELLQNHNSRPKLNLNLVDDICGYTPLMWTLLLQRKNCAIELFNFSDSIDFNYRTNESGSTAWDMVTSGSSMYNFLNENNMLQYMNSPNNNGTSQNNDNTDSNNNNNHDAIDNIDLKIAGMGIGLNESSSMDQGFTNLHDSSDMYGTEYKDNGYEHFDFTKLVKYQYLEFSDYDIPQILDFLTSLPFEHQHITTYPAALLFQCIRYADRKKKSPQLVQSLVSLSFTRIVASVTNEKPLMCKNGNKSKSKREDLNDETATSTTLSDAVPLSEQKISFPNDDDADRKGTRENKNKKTESLSKGDIITQSYWISALTFLYYYLSKDESFFKRYPILLQELINTIHSIIIELTISIHSRLSPLIEPTLINYTTIKDVEQTLYKKDWNFFKKRKQAKLLKKEKLKKLEQQKERKSLEVPGNDEPNENNENPLSRVSSRVSNNDSIIFDSEVLKHLLPPSLQEQMKPSPVKIVQIFGALSYVLNLHQVHPLFQQQCLSLATSWFSTSLFNMILKDRKKKTLSRARAIQIRLNLSSLESWIKNNDLFVQRPKLIDDFMWERFPYTLIQELNTIDMSNPSLKSVTTYKPTSGFNENSTVTDMTNSLFYYQKFHKIAQWHMEPIFELLQWLQIATTLDSEEALENTKTLLPKLSDAQLVKAIDKYHYEVGEHKFNSKLKKCLTNEIKRHGLTEKAYLDENQIPLLALPTVPELTDAYANEYEYLPVLPNDIQDTMYDIHDENYKMRLNDNGIVTEQSEEEEEDSNDANEMSKENIDISEEHSNVHYGSRDTDDNIFKEIDAPSASVSRPVWATNNDIDDNPW